MDVDTSIMVENVNVFMLLPSLSITKFKIHVKKSSLKVVLKILILAGSLPFWNHLKLFLITSTVENITNYQVFLL